MVVTGKRTVSATKLGTKSTMVIGVSRFKSLHAKLGGSLSQPSLRRTLRFARVPEYMAFRSVLINIDETTMDEHPARQDALAMAKAKMMRVFFIS